MEILERFEELLPLACAWAEAQERHILDNGVPLAASELADAARLGVAQPECVRLLRVAQVPMPDDPILGVAAVAAGLVSPGTSGMALRYGIFLRDDCWRDRKIIVHELAHTAQYERLGGFAPFLRQYLTQCLTVGYRQAPLECEAVAAAESFCPSSPA